MGTHNTFAHLMVEPVLKTVHGARCRAQGERGEKVSLCLYLALTVCRVP